MSKQTLTDFVSVLFIALAFVLPLEYSHISLYIGLFAISGAITNQLAIYMLFERVPLLYGSGVIEKNFSTFKKSIKAMIMSQFFTKEQLSYFFAKEEQSIDLVPLIKSTDFSPAFDALSQTVMESKFGGAVAMFGGEAALEEMREPFTDKLKSTIAEMTTTKEFKDKLQENIINDHISDDLLISIESLIDTRLAYLTPKMVKELIQDLIREHLGWLVVWGGVFGGLIGLVSSLFIG